MAVAIVDLTTARRDAGGGGSFLIPAPSGIVAGMVLVSVVNSSSAIPSPTGWNVVQYVTFESRDLAIQYKIATGSEPASYNFGGAVSAVGGVYLLSGVDVSTPVDASSSARNIAPSDPVTSAATLPSMTTTQGGSFLITGVGGVNVSTTWGDPSGMVERYEIDSVDTVIQHASHAESISAVGATGTRVFPAGIATRWGVAGVAFMARQGRWWAGVAGWGQV